MTTGATGQLGLALPVQGELSGTWGDTVNNGITQYTNIAIAGTLTLTGDGAVTLSNTTGDASASNIVSTLTGAGTVTAQFAIVRVTGTLTVAKVVTAPSYSKTYTVVNAATGGIVTFKASGQTGISIAVGESALVYFNGTDYVKAASSTATGDVVGPASSTDNAFARFDSTTGKLLQNSTGATLSDTGAAVFTGALDVLGNSTAGSNIKLYEDTDNGTNYVSFKAPDTIAANVTWTLPSADGTSAQVLSTNGSGTLSWATAGASQWTTTGSDIYYNTGNVAVGSAPKTYSLGKALEVGFAGNGINGASQTQVSLIGNAYYNGAWKYGGTGKAAFMQIDAGVILWYNTDTSGTADNNITGFTERARIPTTGGFQSKTTISVGDATPSTSGAGITFPATQSASSDANTLDDYEEGTFTPTLTAATTAPTSVSYAYQVGKYTKVGRLVTVNVDLQINSRSGGSGSARIGNLPFTNSASDSFIGNGYLGQVAWGAGKTALYFSVVASNTLVNIGSTGTGVDPSGIAITEFNNTDDYISFCVTYSV